MEQIESRLAALEEKLEHVKKTTDRTYKFFMITVIVTVVSVVLPLIGMAFVLPAVISGYSSALGL